MRRLWPLFSARKRVPGSAKPFEDGVAAYHRGDYGTALKFWRPLAEQGNSPAQYNLGRMYDAGDGVPQDDAEAVKWWLLAAEHGKVSAQGELGQRYMLGWGVQGGR